MSRDYAPGSNLKISKEMIGKFFVSEYHALAGKVRAAVHPQEPHRWVHEALIAAYDAIEALDPDDTAAHERVRSDWTNSTYVVTVATRRFFDHRRKTHRITGTDPETGKPVRSPRETLVGIGPEQEPPVRPASTTVLTPEAARVPDEVPSRLTDNARRRALTVVLTVLSQRGQSNDRTITSITADQWETLQYLATVRDVEAEAEQELTDDEVHRRVQAHQRRARQRWSDVLASVRAGRGWPARRDGSEAAVADELDVARSTITRRLGALRETVEITRYVAGVLAPEHALLDVERVRLQLDAFDGLQHAAAPDHRLLKQAASLVRTTEATGTRVDRHAYESAHLTPADRLHEVETAFAATTGTPHPNCVALCDAHNPTRNRATEI